MIEPPEIPEKDSTDMRFETQRKRDKTIRKFFLWAFFVLFVGIVLGLTHDIIITNYLAHQICKAEPNPKTFIKKTVDNPGSIYWEDNIYPGFDDQDRLLMIRNYLDGVHLTTMALNGPDGTITLFTATEKDWQASLGIKKKTEQDWKDYFKAMEKEAKAIADRGKTISRQDASKLNFKVVFNPVALTSFQRRYLYSDEVIITENKINEVIGYNHRLMRLWYILLPDFEVGNRYYCPEAMCGSSGYLLEGSVFNYYLLFHGDRRTHTKDINYLLYFKIIKRRMK
jgi:hypothetical protein